jgi:hypothetical protein
MPKVDPHDVRIIFDAECLFGADSFVMQDERDDRLPIGRAGCISVPQGTPLPAGI